MSGGLPERLAREAALAVANGLSVESYETEDEERATAIIATAVRAALDEAARVARAHEYPALVSWSGRPEKIAAAIEALR